MSRQTLLLSIFAVALVAGCRDAGRSTAPLRMAEPAAVINAQGIRAIDISNGVDASVNGPRTISASGVILGRQGSQSTSLRGWWQAPASAFSPIDDGFVQGGNRNADAGGGQGTAILSTNGGPPWASVAVASPAGVCATCTLVRDMNDARVMVGNTLGSSIVALEWSSPTAIPVRLPTPATSFPPSQVIAQSINNNGTIVGYVLETVPAKGKNTSSRYEAIVWVGGVPQILPLAPGAVTQVASNINDAGIISGFSGTALARWTPRVDGGYDVAVSTAALANVSPYTGIDACGRIVGGSDTGAWMWDGTTVVMLPTLTGAAGTARALDINDAGTIIGASTVGSSHGNPVFHATIWSGLAPCVP
jgi:hypothetical protein